MKSIQESSALQVSEDISEALAFLGPIMRPGNAHLLGPEYPLVYGMPGRGGARLIKQKEVPVAGSVFAAFDAVTQPTASLRIGAVGSVGTHQDFRGKGYARQAVEACEKALRDQGCALALLWSQVPEVFRKLGYTEAGVEVAFSVSDEEGQRLPRPAGVVMPLDPERDLKDCLALYENQPLRVRRTLEEFRRLTTIPGMEMWIHRHARRTTAYGMVGKGTDFPETMHEWGGDAEGVVAILRHHLAQNQREQMTVIGSAARSDFAGALKTAGIEPIFGVMGLFKILDPQRLLASVEAALSSYGIEASWRNEKFFVRSPAGEVSWNEAGFLRFLLGYRGVTGETLEAAAELCVPAFKTAPAVQAFLWGLDSI